MNKAAPGCRLDHVAQRTGRRFGAGTLSWLAGTLRDPASLGSQVGGVVVRSAAFAFAGVVAGFLVGVQLARYLGLNTMGSMATPWLFPRSAVRSRHSACRCWRRAKQLLRSPGEIGGVDRHRPVVGCDCRFAEPAGRGRKCADPALVWICRRAGRCALDRRDDPVGQSLLMLCGACCAEREQSLSGQSFDHDRAAFAAIAFLLAVLSCVGESAPRSRWAWPPQQPGSRQRQPFYGSGAQFLAKARGQAPRFEHGHGWERPCPWGNFNSVRIRCAASHARSGSHGDRDRRRALPCGRREHDRCRVPYLHSSVSRPS